MIGKLVRQAKIRLVDETEIFGIITARDETYIKVEDSIRKKVITIPHDRILFIEEVASVESI